MEYASFGIKQLHEIIKSKKASVVEITQAFLSRIKKNEHLNCYITLCAQEALAQAKEVDKKIAKNEEVGMLAGIVYGVKDAICTKGIRSTGGAKILDNYFPPYSSTIIDKIQMQGGIMLGKHNCDAFGHGASNENSDYGPVKNPWDTSRVSGGSSGGSAAALAAGLCTYAIAEDTGGSIRQPAGFCSVTGLKPSYGRNSRYGIMPMASSLDTIGPMAKSVTDIAILMEIMAGQDAKDATTLAVSVPRYTQIIEKKLPKYTIGIPREYFADGLDSGVRKVIDEAIVVFTGLGVNIKEVSLPMTKYAIAAYYIIVPSEDSANLARLDGIRYGMRKEQDSLFATYTQSRQEGLPQEVKRRIMIGTYALSAGYYDAYYKKAQRVRTLIIEDFNNVFKEVDVLLTPISPTVPFQIGEKLNDPLAMYLADIYTVPASIAGLCGLALPAGFANNLPVGMQLIGKQKKEEEILHLGNYFQKETNWHKKAPPMQ